MNLQSFFQISLLFWIILDPIGNIPIVVSLLKDYSIDRQRKIVTRELLFSLVILLLFFFFGLPFFTLLDIEQPSLQVAGSISFFLIGTKMLLPKKNHESKTNKTHEPYIVPLATPAIAGPGIIAAVMFYGGNQEYSKPFILSAILLAWLATVPLLLGATYLKKLLKENGLVAIERLFAYIVLLLSVQMAIDGITTTFSS